MNIKDFRDNFKAFLSEWNDKRVSIPLEAAVTQASIASDRVIRKGENSEGNKFGTYAKSTRKTKVRKGQTRSPFPTINFSDTNTMWRTTIPKVRTVSSETVVIDIGPRDQQRNKIMGIHNERFNTKLAGLNEQESNNLRDDYKDEFVNLFNKYFGR